MLTLSKSSFAVGAVVLGLTAGAATASATPLTSAPASSAPATAARTASVAPRYHNPLALTLPNGKQAANCADPFVYRTAKNGSARWYLYCTSDALTPTELKSDGTAKIHVLPTYTSRDMVHWAYKGDAVTSTPSWVGGGSMWAPDLVRRGGKYLLYYTASDTPAGTQSTGGGSAIGVLVGKTPLGPWTDSGHAVVEPQPSPYGTADSRRWVFDPEVITVGRTSYMYYGSYFGGVSVRRLSADGLSSISSSQRQITIDNRYEGTFIVRHGGWFYFMGSATNCCNGPLTAYSVFAGRSRSPLGPFRDRHGVSLLATRVGGTPVLMQNGNKWVGAGHNAVVTDYAGQQWIYYHAVDRRHPYVPGQAGYTKRTLLLDPLDWRNGWPVANGGRGPSNSWQPGPAAQPGQRTAYRPHFVGNAVPGRKRTALSDEFTGTSLGSRWAWVRKPAAGTYRVANGQLIIKTQDADLQPPAPADKLASVLTEPAPESDYVVQTKVSVSVPNDGSVHNFVQGGLVIYTDDGNYLKLSVTSIFDTRQTEFGKHVAPVPTGYPSYGNGVVGPVGRVTYLRVVRHQLTGSDRYTAYTSLDGKHWDKGDTWTFATTLKTRIGLISMGGAGYETRFAYVHVNSLKRA